MRSGAVHDIHEPYFKRLKRWGGNRHKTALEIRGKIAIENANTREMQDSWADIDREKERQKRIQKIKELWAKKTAS